MQVAVPIRAPGNFIQRFFSLAKSFSPTYWVALIAELFERMMWYGLEGSITLFLTGAVAIGGLGLTHEEKGSIMGIFPFIVYLVPLISGTLGERYGYKRVLLAAFALLSAGYYFSSYAKGYYSALILFSVIAFGAGFFKPMIPSTIKRATLGDAAKFGIGLNIFYAVINIGGFTGPMISAEVRPTVHGNSITGSWSNVFYLSAGYGVAMFLWILFMYPNDNKRDSTVSLLSKFKDTVRDLYDLKLASLIVILSGFWAMFRQLFITLTSWIQEWIDTSALIPYLPASWFSNGQLKPEYIINLDSLVIIFCNIKIANMVEKKPTLRVITSGTIICALSFIGIAVIPLTGHALASALIIGMLILFAIGEMMSSPKTIQLMGDIAPPNKTAVYQGYGFIANALGFLLAGKLSGLYGTFADKTLWYKQELINHFGENPNHINNLELYQLAELLRKHGFANVQEVPQNHKKWVR
jgi:dipeptide/tripeptide permease